MDPLAIAQAQAPERPASNVGYDPHAKRSDPSGRREVQTLQVDAERNGPRDGVYVVKCAQVFQPCRAKVRYLPSIMPEQHEKSR